MPQDFESTAITESVLTSQLDYPCAGPQDTYGNQVTSDKVKVWNLEESRPKPVDLTYSQTAQEKQYEWNRVWGRVEAQPLHWLNEYCNGSWQKVMRRSWFYYQHPSSPIGTIPDTNWQLAARLKLKDLSLNLGQSLVEYRDTARMFHGFAKGALNAWRLVRGRLPRRRRLSPCDIATANLTMAYGVMPLASDLYESFERLQLRLGLPLTVRLSVKDEAEASVSEAQTTGEWQVSERATVYADLDPETIGDFTLGNPAELAWEVIPFSFVVDWAIPIGETLSTLDALKGVKNIRGTVTRKQAYQGTTVYGATSGQTIESNSTYDYKSHERTVISSIPLPRVPTWEPSTSWRAVANGISLLTSINHRCQKRR